MAYDTGSRDGIGSAVTARCTRARRSSMVRPRSCSSNGLPVTNSTRCSRSISSAVTRDGLRVGQVGLAGQRGHSQKRALVQAADRDHRSVRGGGGQPHPAREQERHLLRDAAGVLDDLVGPVPDDSGVRHQRLLIRRAQPQRRGDHHAQRPLDALGGGDVVLGAVEAQTLAARAVPEQRSSVACAAESSAGEVNPIVT